MTDSTTFISEDAPLADPDQDRLGYSRFARHLAEMIYESQVEHGLVIALTGPWGSGKSTMLNFTCMNLQAKAHPPLIVRFNPWWYSSQADLVRSFLTELSASVPAGAWTQLRSTVSRLSDRLSGVSVGPVGVAWREEKTLFELKEELEAALARLDRRIVVVIDDIDRLQGAEIRRVFKLVKSIANLPGVIYLLAFDEQVVTSGLDEVLTGHENEGAIGSGAGYLKKIVQLPIRMPEADPAAVRSLFFETLEGIFQGIQLDDSARARWERLVLEGLNPLLRTPRNVVRLLNVISVTYPAVRGEVNSVDFVGYQALRIFAPSVHELILRDPKMFAPTDDVLVLRDHKKDEYAEFHQEWLSAVQHDREAIRTIVEILFPLARSLTDQVDQEAIERERRICSPAHFPIYARLDVPEGVLRRSEIEDFLKTTNDEAALRDYLYHARKTLNPDGSTRLRSLLDGVLIHHEEISDDGAKTILAVLLNIGDELFVESDKGYEVIFTIDNRQRISRILFRLSKRDLSGYLQLLKKCIQRGSSVSAPVREVYHLSRENGRSGRETPQDSNDRRVSSEEVIELEELAVVRIEHEANKEQLLINRPHLSFLLHCWIVWGGEKKLRKWANRILRHRQLFPKLLAAHLNSRQSHVGYRMEEEWELSLDALSAMVDLREAQSLADELLDSELSLNQKERIALEQMAQASLEAR